MTKQEKIELEVPAGTKEEEGYKQKVVFLRRSKKGAHLYAFNYEGALGGDVGSLIMDVSEVERLLMGSTEWIKVGVVPAKEEGK